ncbi:MAG: hypothetical protein P8Y58_01945 [Novosphingobium sp.]
MNPESTIPVAPALSMPEPLQTIFFWISLAAAIGMLIYAIFVARRVRSLIPVFLVFGAFCSIPLESIVGYLGHVVHPAGGSIALFSAVDRTIPWHIALGYTAGFGAVYLIIYQKALSGKLYQSTVFKTAATTAVLYFLGETVGVSTGLWAYFEPQPLWIWKMTEPPIWGMLNASSEIFGACLIVFLLPHLQGIRQALVVVICPIATLMAHFGAGFPWYNAINSSASPAFMNAATLLSMALAVVVWWISSILATAPNGQAQ